MSFGCGPGIHHLNNYSPMKYTVSYLILRKLPKQMNCILNAGQGITLCEYQMETISLPHLKHISNHTSNPFYTILLSLVTQYSTIINSILDHPFQYFMQFYRKNVIRHIHRIASENNYCHFLCRKLLVWLVHTLRRLKLQ